MNGLRLNFLAQRPSGLCNNLDPDYNPDMDTDCDPKVKNRLDFGGCPDHIPDEVLDNDTDLEMLTGNRKKIRFFIQITCFYFKSHFFQKILVFSRFSVYIMLYIAKIAENLSSIVGCTLHRIKVPEPVTVK